ncbi:MAG TPA: hydrogenase maturation protease [Candidatus Udaeobacter sp.]|jgi:hydrogenase maturation protease
MKRILVAGIGNIFFGDDAFGCEVTSELIRRGMPDGVTVRDFGIRGYDLAYAMMGAYDATVLIDASPRGDKPGTVYTLELDSVTLDNDQSEVADAHNLTPVRVLQLVHSLGGTVQNLYLVGCEPGMIEPMEGEMGLSEHVRNAVEPAAEMVEQLVKKLLAQVK